MAQNFKQIQVSEAEWNRYKKLADSLTQEIGFKVHINGLIKKAVDTYEDTRTTQFVDTTK